MPIGELTRILGQLRDPRLCQRPASRDAWSPAIESDGGKRDGAWVAEATGLVGLDSRPPGTRLIRVWLS